MIKIYTDGSCLNNPGNGGWAAIIIKNDEITEISGNEKNTTNNRMELLAPISALNKIKDELDIEIYTDGSCLTNPGNGGWAAIINDEKEIRKISGSEKNTTNNRMELLAPINALKDMKPGVEIKIYTDSQYVKNGITEWINTWLANNWKTSKKEDVKNKDLWIELYNLNKSLNVQWNWVKAHDGNPMNEEVDLLAKKAANLD